MKAGFRKLWAFRKLMKVSIKHIAVLCALIFLFTACGKKEKELTPQQIRAKADSIVRSKMEKMKKQAKEDLDRRLPIEIKPKIDSIQKTGHHIEPVPVFPEDNAGPDDTDASPQGKVKK